MLLKANINFIHSDYLQYNANMERAGLQLDFSCFECLNIG